MLEVYQYSSAGQKERQTEGRKERISGGKGEEQRGILQRLK